MSAGGHEPETYRNITPPMMVSDSVDPNAVVVSTGRTFAGT